MTLNLAETSVVKSRPSVLYEANFYCWRELSGNLLSIVMMMMTVN